ncbi:hypothetical protein HMPREF1357_02566 [Enterococcus faecium C497]|nr:hypothetical protein HMPREF1357_02566 [Enterococcus faecium C497]MCZ1525667.1 hypothetical protein [Enterococcus faecium]QDZ65036.1 hypothetical protein E3T52_13945 [Enterococcus faecium]QNG07000.1 hypothetical protein FQ488_15205 [Enterococcus hirae]
MWVRLTIMKPKEHLIQIVITIFLAFIYTWIDSGKIELLKTLLISLIFLCLFYGLPLINKRNK